MLVIMNWLTANYLIVVGSLAVIVFIMLIVLLVQKSRLNRLERLYKTMMQGAEGKNFEQMILKNTQTMEQIMLKLDIMTEKVSTQELISTKSIQRVGLVRFNAFHDMGGDLSFALALLDQKGNGVVLSSIYGRDDARTYAKPIIQGKSTYQLSEEEEEAIRKTLKQG